MGYSNVALILFFVDIQATFVIALDVEPKAFNAVYNAEVYLSP